MLSTQIYQSKPSPPIKMWRNKDYISDILSEYLHKNQHATLHLLTAINDDIKDAFEELFSLKVIISNQSEIKEYLFNHSQLIPILKSLAKDAQNTFDANTEISLSLHNDQEIADDQHLVIYVRQKPYDKDIMQKIRAIRSSYNNAISKASPGWILLTTDFYYPKYL